MSGGELETLRRWLLTGAPPGPPAEPEADDLAAAAAGQGLAPLLHLAVAGREPGWPAGALARLRQEHQRAALRAEQRLDTARRAGRPLAQAGARVLPLKGLALLGRFYDEPAHRPMADVDLLALERHEQAALALRAEGFLPVAEAAHAHALRDPSNGVVLELHRALTSCPSLFPFPADRLWERAAQAGLGRVPSPEDLLVHLSLHAAFQHGFAVTLLQLLDFRRVLERSAPHPERLLEAAREHRAERVVAAALEAARGLVGAPVPGPVRERFARFLTPGVGRLLRRLLRDPARFLADPSPLSLGRARFCLAAGRRVELLRLTLGSGPAGSRPWGALARAGRLAADLARGLTRARHAP